MTEEQRRNREKRPRRALDRERSEPLFHLPKASQLSWYFRDAALVPGWFPSAPPRSRKWNHVIGHWLGFHVSAIGQAIGELQDPLKVMSACRCLPEEGDLLDGLAAHNVGSRGLVETSTPVRLAPWGARARQPCGCR